MKTIRYTPLIVIALLAITLKVLYYPPMLLQYGLWVIVMKICILYIKMVIPVHRSIRVLLLIFDWVSTLIYFITIAVSFSIGWINADWNSPISFLPVLAAVIFDILTITFFEIVEKSIKSSIQRKLYSKKNSTQKNVKL